MRAMSGEERRRRADAERNRVRLLDAAQELFRERGLEVGVGEIAERAGIGRGTLFRNFPTKEHLITAIIVERMHEAIERGSALREAADPSEALFEFLEYMAGAQQVNRMLFEAIADQWLANEEIRAGHAEVIGVVEVLLARAQATGTIRDDISAIDLMMLLKGVCEAANALSQTDPNIVQRHLDLVRAALVPPATPAPLRGRPPTLGDIEQAFSQPAASPGAAAGSG
jgi:AcrR family transcriptional regulator